MRPLGVGLILAATIVSGSPVIAAPPNALWVSQFGTQEEDFAVDVDADDSGEVAVLACQRCLNQTASKLVVRRYDSTGSLLWKRTIAGDGDHHSRRLVLDKRSGDTYVVGYIYRDGPQPYGPVGFVTKVDRAGSRQWEQQFGSTTRAAESAAVHEDGTVFVVGGTAASDARIVTFSPEGERGATLRFGTSGADAATDIAFDTSGSAYVVGRTTGVFPGQSASGGSDVFLAKFDRFGTQVWIRQFAPGVVPAANEPTLAVLGSGHAFIGGRSSGSGSDDAYVRAYDPIGEFRWQRELASAEADIAYDLDVDGRGNVSLGGFTFGPLADPSAEAGSAHALVATYDLSGRLVAITQFDTPDGVAGVLGIALGPPSPQSQPLYVAGGATGAFPGEVSSGDADNFVIRLR